ncbi:phosphatase PAP2 family protein [Salinimicrobium sp. GXAS 041]|uniref:phosphatase PAP2 family protein n=1 Tax=Salinimicrobium sp. GXAS 041 TaxID=3400806 RepID=UPI003C743521
MNRIIVLLFIFLNFSTYSQTSFSTSESPYELDWSFDGPYLGGSLGLTGVGFYLIQNKEGLTEEQVANLNKGDIWAIDRWSAGNYSENADKVSYYPFFGSFAAPVVMMLADKDQRSHMGQISVMYVETMATTGALFSMSVGLIDRYRPLVYGDDAPMSERTSASSTRSFFAGHTAATAAASFFTAKIFNDFHPDSWATPYVWAVAAAVPAYVGYLRHIAGKHFLTDNILGYGIGAFSGILIPELHKKENSNISLTPTFGNYMGVDYQGMAFRYTF